MVENSDYLDIENEGLNFSESAQVDTNQELEGELHLRFFLPSGDEFALPALGIREVMEQEAERITPIPNASPLLLGTINLRGQIIWVADLGQFLGYAHVLNVDRGQIPVIAIEEQETILGLAVEKLGAMEWLNVEKLQIPQNVPDSIAPYIQGEWQSNENGDRYVRLLDQIAILRSARWIG